MKAVRTLKSQAGFSLIELMIVVAIIGILASIAVPNFQKFQRRAKQTEGKGMLASVFTAEKSFNGEWNTYVACMDYVGVVPDGKGYYTTGFATQTVNLATGFVGNAACGGGLSARFVQPGLPFAGYAFPAAAAGTDASTSELFTAGATAILNPAVALIDTWTIDQAKNVSNTISGI